ncbi:hypothetical protein [Nevskia ramosa]|uniref:hypothetical protein n=1 Tax=Nevskia ramosa TaxID=64002 RepID=UPI0003B4E069|nr:hypothetical protein [Nevskia ramosa]
MQQAETKGSSEDGIKQVPSLDGFRAARADKFGYACKAADGEEVKFYSVNPGASVADVLGEILCVVNVIEALSRGIAERVDGNDEIAAQLAYGALRFAEQASALTSSALSANWVQS